MSQENVENGGTMVKDSYFDSTGKGQPSLIIE